MTETLDNLLKSFQETWQAGKDARLFLECHAGQVWTNLQLRISHPPPPKHHHPLKPGPSCLRRRARRAEAREAAEKAASSEPSTIKETAEVAAQTENTAKETCDVAEQADLHVAVPAAQHHHEGAQAS